MYIGTPHRIETIKDQNLQVKLGNSVIRNVNHVKDLGVVFDENLSFHQHVGLLWNIYHLQAVVLEGKYWKRKLAAVTAEYKRWRMFYRNNLLGHMPRDNTDTLSDVELLVWDSNSSDNMNMMVDEDYMGLMSDTLFSTITNQPFVFPDSREIAKAGLADFIQPSLGPLQPNLDDYMDTFDPLQEFITSRLPTVPEENQTSQQSQQTVTWGYLDNSMSTSNSSLQNMQSVYSKSMDNIYPTYSQQNISNQVMSSDRICLPLQEATQTAQQQTQQTQQLQRQQQSVPEFKLVPTSQDNRQVTAYKFPVPAAPNIKFTSPQVQHSQMMQPPFSSQSQYTSTSSTQKDEKPEPRRRGAPRGRGRSRSNTREPIKRPPLISAISDPSLLTPQTSVLLTQLLTNSTESTSSLYSQSQSMGSSHDILSTQIRVKEETNSVPILPQPPPTTLIIPAQVSINTVHPSTSDPLLLNTFSNSNSPDSKSQTIHSPTSSQGSIGSPNRETSHRDRRVGHIHAEQKRRYNIKNGFDMIHSLIPHLNQNPNAKLSKAAMLQKGAEYIRQLRAERNQLKEEMDSLRQQIETLNTSISNCQSMLPATGAPVSRRRDSRMQEMFDDYVRTRTMDNWKFWIFSLIFRPLLNSFNNFVSTSSLDDLYSSTLLWIEQHCTLVDLRPVVLNSLRYLCTKTDILSEPDKLPDEARQMVLGNNQNQNN
ncbi:hypothetical protein NQ314_000995 [Rhamnusium bicolor]|uniref:BHLH domain-containing protein n=1 Tax=Rhamnusium bicolor TaxID=1586634 RepID=A0AAV8ZVG9_9CUCU|nr:hypothetical protein NQ314_000995 [Rhamnusium bicolor]